MKWFLVFVLLLTVIACSSSHSLIRPEENDVKKLNTTGTTVTMNDLNNGYHLFLTNCGGCHSLYVPSSKNKTEWEKVLPEMFSRTQLNNDQQKLVRQYIFSKL